MSRFRLWIENDVTMFPKMSMAKCVAVERWYLKMAWDLEGEGTGTRFHNLAHCYALPLIVLSLPFHFFSVMPNLWISGIHTWHTHTPYKDSQAHWHTHLAEKHRLNDTHTHTHPTKTRRLTDAHARLTDWLACTCIAHTHTHLHLSLTTKYSTGELDCDNSFLFIKGDEFWIWLWCEK